MATYESPVAKVVGIPTDIKDTEEEIQVWMLRGMSLDFETVEWIRRTSDLFSHASFSQRLTENVWQGEARYGAKAFYSYFC